MTDNTQKQPTTTTTQQTTATPTVPPRPDQTSHPATITRITESYKGEQKARDTR